MLSCKEVTELVSTSLDRKLNIRQRVGIRLHLLICEGCTNFVRQMKVVRAATRRLAEGEAGGVTETARLSEQARSRIRDTLQEAGHQHKDPHD